MADSTVVEHGSDAVFHHEVRVTFTTRRPVPRERLREWTRYLHPVTAISLHEWPVDPGDTRASEDGWEYLRDVAVDVDPDPTISAMVGVFDDPLAWDTLGPAMTCVEAERVAAFLRRYASEDLARSWLDGHARGDDEGDAHWRGDPS